MSMQKFTKSYAGSDFIEGTERPDSKKVLIDKKINLLYDFSILTNDKTGEGNENRVRAILKQFETESQMTTAIHDLVFGDETIDEFIERYVRKEFHRELIVEQHEQM